MKNNSVLPIGKEKKVIIIGELARQMRFQGVSGPGVVKKALEKVRGKGFEELCETIKKTAFKVTRVGQLVAGEASARLGIPFGIVDLSLAPTPAVGDSVAEILEEIGLERVGAPGTTAALAMLNDQVKKGGVMASSFVMVVVAMAIVAVLAVTVLWIALMNLQMKVTDERKRELDKLIKELMYREV